MLAAVLLAGAAGCTDEAPEATGPVDVPAPPVSGPEVDAVCAQLSAALPDEVDPGVGRREVTGDPDRTAAWGEPPVTLQCGVPPPERFETDVVVNGVTWTVRDIGPGFRWMTSGRVLNVSVTVPDAYENPVELIYPLSAPVASTVPTAPAASPAAP